jgi:hypothetical protein
MFGFYEKYAEMFIDKKVEDVGHDLKEVYKTMLSNIEGYNTEAFR